MGTTTALCTYSVAPGKEAAFLEVLLQHWPVLRELGLATEEPPLLFRGTDESTKTFFVEILTWKSADGPTVAEQTPKVMAIWERMGALLEARLGRPAMEFPHVERVERA